MKADVFFDLLFWKAQANLKAEVSRYYLNIVWWVIDPTLNMLVLYLVFGIFMPNRIEHFVLFLFIGTVVWAWYANSVTQCASSIYNASAMMLNTTVPKIFYPLELFIQCCFKFSFSLSVLIAFVCIYPVPFSMTWVSLPLVMLVQAVWTLSNALICAALIPFLPDARFIVTSMLHLGMFASGLFYNIDSVVLPDHRWLVYLNPMAGLIREYRNVIISGLWPDITYLCAVFAGSAVVLLVGFALIRRFDALYPRICQR